MWNAKLKLLFNFAHRNFYEVLCRCRWNRFLSATPSRHVLKLFVFYYMFSTVNFYISTKRYYCLVCIICYILLRLCVCAFYRNYCKINFETKNLICVCLVSECVLSSCEMNSDSLKFIVLGDFGGKKDSPYVTRKQLIVAEAMNTIAGKHSAQFYISCGDNFYPRGVANVSDPRFQVQYNLLIPKMGYNLLAFFAANLRNSLWPIRPPEAMVSDSWKPWLHGWC